MIGINIKMPSDCWECELSHIDYADCLKPIRCVIDGDCVSEYRTKRPDWCPLIELEERSDEES